MNPNKIMVSLAEGPTVDSGAVEIVERKGIGHPDTICDGIVEAVCLNLCQEYKDRFGLVLHHNIDKALLVAGQSNPRPGGGEISLPMRFIFGDRGVYECKGVKIPIGDIARDAARSWLKKNLRFVDPDEHVIFQNEIKYGSAELVENLLRKKIGANDTSVGVGYAPLTRTEQTVIAVENWLNSAAFKKDYPESGEDIKVMGVRRGDNLELIVAMAFVDAWVKNSESYFGKKLFLNKEIQKFVCGLPFSFNAVNVEMNTLDRPDQGESGMYLTVLGTSAEAGDSGQVGRGNRINGIIPYNRPMTAEAACGKNPTNHTGKIYSILSHQAAARIYEKVPGIAEVTVWLCSKIGDPLGDPLLASVEVKSLPGVGLEDLQQPVTDTLEEEFANIDFFTQELRMGEFRVY